MRQGLYYVVTGRGSTQKLVLKRDLFITENPEHYRKLKQRFSDMLKAETEGKS